MWGLSNEFMGWTSGILLSGVTLLMMFALLKKPKHDPQRGQAVGCLMIVLLVMVALGGGLAISIIFEWHGLLKAIFTIVVFPIAWVILGLLYNLFLLARTKFKREGRE